MRPSRTPIGLLVLATVTSQAVALPIPTARPRLDLYGDPHPAGAVARLGTLRLRPPGHIPAGVAFTADGKHVVTWGAVLTISETATGKTIAEHRPGPVRAVRLDRDGRSSMAVTESHRIVQWGTDTERAVALPVVTDRGSTAAAIAPDGKAVAVGHLDGTVHVCDPAGPKTIRVLTGPKDDVTGLAFSPDGKTLARGGSKSAGLWDLATGTETRLFDDGRGPICVAFSPDGKSIVTGEYFGKPPIRVWDVATVRERYAITDVGFGYFPRAVVFAADGRTFAHTGEGGVVFHRDAASGKELRRFVTRWNTYAVAFSPDGKSLAAALSLYPSGSETKIFDMATGKETFNFPRHELAIEAVHVSADGKTAVTSGIDRTIRGWDLATGKERFVVGEREIKTISQPGRPCTIGPDGTSVLVARDDVIGVWDLATGKDVRRLKGIGQTIVAMAPLPTDRAVAVLSVEFGGGPPGGDGPPPSNALHLLDFETGRAERVATGLDHRIRELRTSADGRVLVLAAPGEPCGLRVSRDVATGRKVFAFEPGGRGRAFPPGGVAAAADGKWVAAATANVEYWDVATNDRLGAHDPPAGDWLRALASAPNGKYLAGSVGGGVCVFEARTGRVVWKRDGPAVNSHGLAFTPDGRRLLTACEDGTVLVWELPAEVGTGR